MITAGPYSELTDFTVLPVNARMAPRMDDVMRLCCELSAHEQIKVTVKNSTKGAMVAGGTAFIGGLLGGPAGIAVGKNEYVNVFSPASAFEPVSC